MRGNGINIGQRIVVDSERSNGKKERVEYLVAVLFDKKHEMHRLAFWRKVEVGY